MNVSQKPFILIFSLIENEMTSKINSQTQEDMESFTVRFSSNIRFNEKKEILTRINTQALEGIESFT